MATLFNDNPLQLHELYQNKLYFSDFHNQKTEKKSKNSHFFKFFITKKINFCKYTDNSDFDAYNSKNID